MKSIRGLKALIYLPSLCFSSILLNSCSDYIDSENASTIKEIVKLKLDYEYRVPGNNPFPYRLFWNGTSNGYDPFGTAESEHVSTFLNNYGEKDGYYTLLYLKKDRFSKYKDFLTKQEKAFQNNEINYHFTSSNEEKVIDGKFFFAHQKLFNFSHKNIKLVKEKNLDNVKFTLTDGFQLSLCLRSENLTIKSDISHDKDIGKTIKAYKREPLIFGENGVSNYTFSSQESYNQKIIDLGFSYEGERIELFLDSFHRMQAVSFPTLGMGRSNQKSLSIDVISDSDGKYASLPRYEKINGNYSDLLSDDINENEDIFLDKKSALLDAYVKDDSRELSDHTKYGLFDYEKFLSILKGQ